MTSLIDGGPLANHYGSFTYFCAFIFCEYRLSNFDFLHHPHILPCLKDIVAWKFSCALGACVHVQAQKNYKQTRETNKMKCLWIFMKICLRYDNFKMLRVHAQIHMLCMCTYMKIFTDIINQLGRANLTNTNSFMYLFFAMFLMEFPCTRY